MNSPPLLFSFQSIDQYLDAVSQSDKAKYGDEILKLLQLNYPPVVSLGCLAVLLGFSSDFVGSLYHRPEKYYRHFTVPKGRLKRHIYAPKIALKIILSWFGSALADGLKIQPCVYGFVKGRSAIQAAQVHCNSSWVFSTDIKDFFPSTKRSHVAQSLVSIGYSELGANIIAKLCCYNDGLAQGSPASPVLSNLVFTEADKEIMSLVARSGIKYTRYADDLVFSGEGRPPEGIESKVRSVIEKYGWIVSDQKQNLSIAPDRLLVHGLIVNDKRPRLTKKYRNKLRTYKYTLDKLGKSARDYSKIRGHLAYAKSIEAIANSPKS